jgi:hypothetical protein
MRAARSASLPSLTLWLAVAVLAELTLLRTGTRTLVHIPGLGRYELSIGVLSELGRMAYYLAVVLVIVTLLYVAWLAWNRGTTSRRLTACLIGSFLAVASIGRLAIVPDTAVAWFSVAVLIGLVALNWNGVRCLPIGLFVAASAVASWTVLAQGTGGGLSGQTIDVAIVVAEGLLILAAATTPLLIAGKITRPALVAGSAVGVLFVAGFAVGGSTLSILTLWNLGVPGWFSPLAYGLGLAAAIVTIWSSVANRELRIACVVLLMIAAGVGPISTYQTALAIAAVALAGFDSERPSGQIRSSATASELREASKEMVASS